MISQSTPWVSVVLPVHNQAGHIAALVRTYTEALAQIGRSCEFILAVNGCRDNSLEVCEALARTSPDVRVISDSRAGWGRAVRAGLDAARGEVLCYTNSARTSAADLRQLILAGIANPTSVIKASRRVRDNWRRRIGSMLYNLECRVLFGLSVWDINATPKVFSRAHAALLTLKEDGDLLDAEFAITCHRHGYPVLEIPIFANRRQGGSTTTNYRSAVGMYLGAYRLWRASGARNA